METPTNPFCKLLFLNNSFYRPPTAPAHPSTTSPSPSPAANNPFLPGGATPPKKMTTSKNPFGSPTIQQHSDPITAPLPDQNPFLTSEFVSPFLRIPKPAEDTRSTAAECPLLPPPSPFWDPQLPPPLLFRDLPAATYLIPEIPIPPSPMVIEFPGGSLIPNLPSASSPNLPPAPLLDVTFVVQTPSDVHRSGKRKRSPPKIAPKRSIKRRLMF